MFTQLTKSPSADTAEFSSHLYIEYKIYCNSVLPFKLSSFPVQVFDQNCFMHFYSHRYERLTNLPLGTLSNNHD
jgi:hypothetical protein